MEIADLDMSSHQADDAEIEATHPCVQIPKISACGSQCLLNAVSPEQDLGLPLRGFKMKEVFADSSVYAGYSLGDHTYRECHHCNQDGLDQHAIFAFSVTKLGHKMSIRFNSTPLLLEVLEIVGLVSVASDGLQLLKHHAKLENHLKSLQSDKGTYDTATVKDLDLLVSGLLSDEEPFCSFGYEKLYQNGYITADRRSSFQQSRIEEDINTINDGFIAVDEGQDVQKDQGHSFLRAVARGQKTPESSPTEELKSPATARSEESHDPILDDQNLSAHYLSGWEHSFVDSCSGNEPIVDDLENLIPTNTKQSPSASWGLRRKNLSTANPPTAENSMPTNYSHRHSPSSSGGSANALHSTREIGHRESIPDIGRHKETLAGWWSRGHEIRDELRTQAVLRMYPESIFRSPETALFMSAANGQPKHVEYILATAQEFSDRTGQHSSCFWNYDIRKCIVDGVPSEWSNMTVLMAAAKSGNESIVKALLHDGCDANVVTRRGSALSVAGETGSAKIMKLLLEADADLRAALLAHGALFPGEIPASSTESQANAIYRLNRAANCFSGGPLAQFNNHPSMEFPSTKFDRLHYAFVKEFTRIETFHRTHLQWHARDSVPSLWAQDRFLWSDGFDRTTRQAWASGIRVMRRLIRGEVPTTLNDTIMFLAIARAIAMVRDNYGGGGLDYSAQFEEDLSRWELLFSVGSANSRNFKKAVLDLWSVDLDIPPAEKVTKPHPNTLLQIQEMVLRLVQEGAPFLSDEGNKSYEKDRVGLLSSQKQWRLWNKFQTNLNADRVNQPKQSHVLERHEPDHLFSKATQPELRPAEVSSSGFIPRCARSINFPHQDFDFRVPLLMVGAIFIFFIAFFLEIDHGQSVITNCTKNGIELPSLQTPVLKAALQHVLLLLDDKAADGLRLSTEWHIDTGFISSFSGLIDHIKTYVMATTGNSLVSEEILFQLSTIHSSWKSSYALQKSHRILEVYLGFKEFVSIVPHILSPAAYSSDDSSQGSVLLAANPSFEIGPYASGRLPSTPAQHPASSSGSPSLPTPLSFSTSTSTPWSSTPATTSSPETAQQARMTFCVECNRDFEKVCNYNKHRNDKHVKKRFHCKVQGCRKSYSRNKPRLEHQAKKH